MMSASSDSESGLEGVEQELLNLQAALGLSYRKVQKHLAVIARYCRYHYQPLEPVCTYGSACAGICKRRF